MSDFEPQSRNEAILDATINGEEYTAPPQSRIEELLLELKETIEEGGGGTGTTNYNNLHNKPSINEVELSGDKTTEDLIPIGTGLDFDDDGKLIVTGGGGGGSLAAELVTSVTVGGIASGTTYEAGTALETIFRDMLNPVAYPTLTNPSATLSATGAKLLEKGATLATTFTCSFSRGSINPAYGTSGYRSGAATGYSLNSGESQEGNTWSVNVTEAQTSYQASVSYAAGEQPKDSIGRDYNSPLPAGSVNSNTVTYEFVNAIWANTSDITSVAKLALVSKSTKQKDMTFPAQTVANPEIFDIPASWTVTAVQVKNDLSGAWEDASSQFTVTDTTHNDAGGTSTAYKRYTFNMGVGTGSRQIRVKWS